MNLALYLSDLKTLIAIMVKNNKASLISSFNSISGQSLSMDESDVRIFYKVVKYIYDNPNKLIDLLKLYQYDTSAANFTGSTEFKQRIRSTMAKINPDYAAKYETAKFSDFLGNLGDFIGGKTETVTVQQDPPTLVKSNALLIFGVASVIIIGVVLFFVFKKA